MRAAIDDGADLALAADVALGQRVAPLLSRALAAADLKYPDASWYRRIQADAARCRAQAVLVQPRIADTVLDPLAGAGFEALVFKGAALATRYPAPGLRPMDDIDLILPKDQHRAALETLRRRGWRQLPLTPGKHHEIALTHPAMPGLPIELHHSFATWRERSSGVTTDDLWHNRRPCRIADTAAFCLPPEHELIAVAAHAARPTNVFGRLLWSVDVAVIVQSASMDWDLVRQLAAAWQCRIGLAVALTQAARLGVDTPEALRQPPAAGTRLAALAPVLSVEWPIAGPDASSRHQLGYALMDDRRRQITFFAGTATEKGIAQTPFRATAIGARAIRRWWQLRARRRRLASAGKALEQSVHP
jgi:hypothetical protein